MIPIFHSSDLHGHILSVYYTAKDFRIWIDTGDFLSNVGRPIDPSQEKDHQVQELRRVLPILQRWLNDRPWIYVPGNHDFADIAEIAAEFKMDNVFNVAANPFEFEGEVFAGFSEIPWIIGEWNREVFDFEAPMAYVEKADPTVLVTHAPPAGILDGEGGNRFGIGPLNTHLFFKPNRIHTHLFGHVHHCGGDQIEQAGIRFVNGATMFRRIEIG